MNERSMETANVRNGGGDRAAPGDYGNPGFFEKCLLVLRRSVRSVFVLPKQSAGQSEGYSIDLRKDSGVVHGSVGTGRRNAQRDLNIYFDYLDGLTPKYLAKKHGITRGRIYQILKEIDKGGDRII